ncbi:tetratricopeptide repeat protein [Corynebacterium canis]|uniref:Tetratricopeptide repeat protein n=2 Tax=Corynebacterium canis TaxID=679663 RepID=A0A5C5UIK6_9CORY|nr:tetratricopeptide repeat protein [Corynebacterium canis]WJY74014.1 Tetratricopeptide repeat protein [Corynebacterium canis]
MRMPSAEQLIEEAHGYVNVGQLDRAEQCLRDAVSLADSADWKYAAGTIAMAHGQHGEAADLFGQCIALVPDSANYHYFAGIALQQAGDLGGAFQCNQRALELDPEYPEAHHHAAFLGYHMGLNPAWIWHELETAEQLLGAPDTTTTSIKLALLWNSGRSTEARLLLNEALARDPQNVVYREMLATMTTSSLVSREALSGILAETPTRRTAAKQLQQLHRLFLCQCLRWFPSFLLIPLGCAAITSAGICYSEPGAIQGQWELPLAVFGTLIWLFGVGFGLWLLSQAKKHCGDISLGDYLREYRDIRIGFCLIVVGTLISIWAPLSAYPMNWYLWRPLTVLAAVMVWWGVRRIERFVINDVPEDEDQRVTVSQLKLLKRQQVVFLLVLTGGAVLLLGNAGPAQVILSSAALVGTVLCLEVISYARSVYSDLVVSRFTDKLYFWVLQGAMFVMGLALATTSLLNASDGGIVPQQDSQTDVTQEPTHGNRVPSPNYQPEPDIHVPRPRIHF